MTQFFIEDFIINNELVKVHNDTLGKTFPHSQVLYCLSELVMPSILARADLKKAFRSSSVLPVDGVSRPFVTAERLLISSIHFFKLGNSDKSISKSPGPDRTHE